MTTKPRRILVDPHDLIGVREIAERLTALGYQVDRSSVTTWISRRDDVRDDTGRITRAANGFPPPLNQVGMGGIYYWPHVIAWVNARYGQRAAS